MLEFGNIKLEDGTDRQVSRKVVRELTGLTDARLSQLRDVLPPLNKKGRVFYSLRVVIAFAQNNPVDETKQRAGRRSKVKRVRVFCTCGCGRSCLVKPYRVGRFKYFSKQCMDEARRAK